MSKSVNKLREASQKAKSQDTKLRRSETVFKSNFERLTIDNIIPDPNLETLIPPLEKEEEKLLEESIRKEGVRDPLIVWNDKEKSKKIILVDGYNRRRIIKKLEGEGLEVKYSIKEKEFKDLEDVKDWMITNQLGRRNLTDEKRSYLRVLRYLREKSRHGGHRRSSAQNEHLKTSEKLGLEYKVGHATIRRDGFFAKGLEKVGKSNPVLKRSILAGDVKIKKGIVQKLGQYDWKNEPEFKAPQDIINFVQKASQKKPKKASPTPDLFIKSRNKIIDLLQTIDEKSTLKDIENIRKMLLGLEKLIKSNISSSQEN